MLARRKKEESSILPYLHFSVSSYSLMGGIGAIAALLFLYTRKDRLNIRIKDLFEYIVVCTVFGAALARLMYVIALIPSMEHITFEELLFQLWNGGIVFYGGLFGVIIGIIGVSKYRNRKPIEVLNVVAPTFPLFHAFARFGCLLAGCCYGIEWSWGVRMIDEENIIRLPVQLFECLCNVSIFIGITIFSIKKQTDKYNLMIYLFSYSICRFVLEFFRGDSIRGIWAGRLSTAQCISIAIIFLYILYYVKKLWIRRKDV